MSDIQRELLGLLGLVTIFGGLPLLMAWALNKVYDKRW